MATDLPRPSQVPGFAAYANRVPTHSPALLPGASAKQLGIRHLGIFALGTAVWVLVLAFVDLGFVVLGGGLALFLLGWFLLGRVGDRLIAELDRGYASFKITTGLFWFRHTGWIGWDFDGVWVLESAGVVAPTPGVTDPPGLYPSPRRHGRLELWTGCNWTKVYRGSLSTETDPQVQDLGR